MFVVAVPMSNLGTPFWGFALWSELGWNHFQLGIALALASVGLPAPVVGYLIDRFGPRRVIVPGLFIVAVGVLLLGLAQGLWIIYAAFAMTGLGISLSGWIAPLTIISRWFVRRRATAVGIVCAAGSVANLFVLLVVVAFDWIPEGGEGFLRLLAGVVLAGVILIVAVPAVAWLRNRPEDVGLLPYGDPPQKGRGNLTTIQALSARAFWFIVLGNAIVSLGITAVWTHAGLLANDRGFSVASVGLGLGLPEYISGLFYLAGGMLGDRFPKAKLLAIFALASVFGIVLLAFDGHIAMFLLAGLLMRIGSSGITVLSVAILADYFGVDSFGKILGLYVFILGLPTYIGSPIVDLIRESVGSYTPAFLLMAGLALLGALCFLMARPPQLPEMPDTVAPQTAPD